ncbi:MAG: preprotein translocase subunit SecG [Planctomycetes bacterium]|jgi:preprotein translocase subunit SecG|nr:preprotein translocase subunit SecG [Planctomycetota bacterium]MBV20781.1 preprotein translocase subunit SecG [Planctomycetaceae bacterium]HJM57317.1 preprotein translocase subunit SecG [Planctomycetota bacterium]
MDLIITFLYILFILAALMLIVVILLQEGKGGGFGDALGVAGQQTFGVKAQGIHKFTMGIAAVFLISALTIHVLNRKSGGKSALDGLGGTSGLDGAGVPAGAPPGSNE